jgi:ABC-2 type transport system ATP-binding protein
MTPKNAVDIYSLEKIYPSNWFSNQIHALKGISLNVVEGEVFGFIGANGAGKSTTIKILTGAIHPSRGIARIFGQNVANHNARKSMGFVPENPSLPDYLTPLEVLRQALALHGIKHDNPDAHCRYWLERFQIGHVASKIIRSFSKGMAQRTALAHAMCIQPKLLILDEPLSGLDPIGRRDVIDILAEYKSDGGTVFLTSHVLNDVERLADRFALIHRGEIKTVKSPIDLVCESPNFVVRSMGEQPVNNMRQDGKQRWIGEVSGDGLWRRLAVLEQAGHRLIEVRPQLGLEQIFLQYVDDSTH